jgi:hypothetical protein
MHVRKTDLSEATKRAIEHGSDLVTSLVDGVDLDALYATGHEQAAKVLAQLPTLAPHVGELKRRASDGVFHVANTIGNQKGLSERSRKSKPHWVRRALLLALCLGIGAAITEGIRRRPDSQSTLVDPETSATETAPQVAEALDAEPAATTPEDTRANGAAHRNGSAKRSGSHRKAPTSS